MCNYMSAATVIKALKGPFWLKSSGAKNTQVHGNITHYGGFLPTEAAGTKSASWS